MKGHYNKHFPKPAIEEIVMFIGLNKAMSFL